MIASRLDAARTPLLRSGFAMAGNTLLTSGLGAIYWVVAARMLEPADVGVGAGLISAMTLLTTITVLNLDNALNRFVPPAGEASRRLIFGSYLVAVPLSAIAGVVFLVGLDVWSPGLAVIRTSVWSMAGFVAATMLWTVFVLQDAALAGLRKATWLPVENGVYGMAKIILLVVLAGSSIESAVFTSWTLPLIAIVIPVNYLMTKRAIPDHVASTTDRAQPFDRRAITRYAAKDYAASAMWSGLAAVLPLLVLELAGADASAYFYLSWTIAYTLYLVSRNIGIALITEGALQPQNLAADARRIFVQTAAIVLPAVVVVLIAAPLILSVFGTEYADGGSTVLRLLMVAAVPNMAVTLFVTIARVEQRMRVILAVNAATLIGVAALSVMLLPRLGVAGVGWAWLVVQTLLAVTLMATGLRPIWVPVVAAIPWRQGLTSQFGVGRKLRRQSAVAASHIPAIIEAETARIAAFGGLTLLQKLPTDLDLCVASLGLPGDTPSHVIKLAATPGASSGVVNEAEVLVRLADDERLVDWRGLVPAIEACGVEGELAYFIESFLDGGTAADHAREPDARDALIVAAAQSIEPLHAATSYVASVTSADTQRWVDEPFGDVVQLLEGRGKEQRSGRCEEMSGWLNAALVGTDVNVCRVHGDFWLGNVLVSDSMEITGIVDWAQSEDDAPVALDLLHLVLTSRMIGTGQSFGAVVVEALDGIEWTPAEQSVLAGLSGSVENGPDMATLVLLTWLRHIASNVRKSYRYRKSTVWIHQNVDVVLETVLLAHRR